MKSHAKGEVLTGVFYINAKAPSFIDMLNVTTSRWRRCRNRGRVRAGKRWRSAWRSCSSKWRWRCAIHSKFIRCAAGRMVNRLRPHTVSFEIVVIYGQDHAQRFASREMNQRGMAKSMGRPCTAPSRHGARVNRIGHGAYGDGAGEHELPRVGDAQVACAMR